MSDGHRSGRSTGRVSCKSTELKRCSMIEMRWNKYEVSLKSPVWTQIRRPSSEIKFRVVELKTPRFSTAIGSNRYAEDRVEYLSVFLVFFLTQLVIRGSFAKGCRCCASVNNSYSYSYRVSLDLKQLFSEESCSVVDLSEKMSFQLRSELSATVERWAEVRWKCVPDGRSRDGETSLADGRVCPQNEQIAAISRTEWPTWRFRNRPDGLLEVTGKA